MPWSQPKPWARSTTGPSSGPVAVTVTKAPELPTEPSAPRTTTNVAVGLVVGLVLLLVSYFISLEPWPVFYWLGLFGLPLGFALMLGYVVAAAIARRRS